MDKFKDQFATAHDLQRSFGTRWSTRAKPATLQILMRHRDINTTMQYYVAQDADDVAADLWAEHQRGSTLGSTGESEAKTEDAELDAKSYENDTF